MRHVIASTLFVLVLALSIPTDIGYASPLFQAPAGEEYSVQPGDSLSRIALEELGDVDAWQQIIDATNAKALEDERFESITDPTLIEVGQLLWIPSDDPVVRTVEPTAEPSDDPLTEPEVDPAVELSVGSTVLPPPASTTVESIRPSARIQLLFPDTLDGRLYGYVDSDGAFQIEPQYVVARRFSEGFAVVSKDGQRFGYIDTAGEMVIPAEFSDAGPFSDGLAAVRAGDSAPTISVYDYELLQEKEIHPSGYINQDGSIVIEPVYAHAEPFSDGIAIVWDAERNRYFLNRAGEIVREAMAVEPTTWTKTFRTSLSSSASKGGTCENSSTFGDHPHIWSCQVDQELYDPCFVQEPSGSVLSCEFNDEGIAVCGQKPAPSAVVCGYPLSPFTAANLEINMAEAAAQPPVEDAKIPRFWISLDGDDDIDCMLIAQDSLNGAPPQLYICSDGSFIIDEFWAVGNSDVWMTRTVELSGSGPDYEFVESRVAIIDQVREFSTSLNAEEPPATPMPPPFSGAYWQY